MAAPGPWVLYNDFKLNLGKKLVNLTSDTFKVALFTSASSAISATVTPATYTAFATDGHEVANGNGYTTGGVAASTPSWTGGGSTTASTFDTADVSWTATAIGGLTSRAAVIYDDTASPKVAIAYMLLDSTPADVTFQQSVVETIGITNVFTLS